MELNIECKIIIFTVFIVPNNDYYNKYYYIVRINNTFFTTIHCIVKFNNYFFIEITLITVLIIINIIIS